MRLAGAVDPRYAGRDLGNVLELNRALGIRINDKLSTVVDSDETPMQHCTAPARHSPACTSSSRKSSATACIVSRPVRKRCSRFIVNRNWRRN
ncbi:MAG: hypothetical protein MZV49_05340 [Rhodopseudomonas palustris]|nr:hypothetical protein [Rhodopseudomonas palustris]